MGVMTGVAGLKVRGPLPFTGRGRPHAPVASVSGTGFALLALALSRLVLPPLSCLHALPGGPCPSGANCCIVRQSRLHVYHRFDTFSFMCLALYIVFHVPSLASTVLPFALHVAFHTIP